MERVADESPDAPGLPYRDRDRQGAEDDEVPGAVVLERLLQDEVDDAAENRALDRAESADHRGEEHLGRPLQVELVAQLDEGLADRQDRSGRATAGRGDNEYRCAASR